ncbi:DUF7507 domain-containing protein, partial [Winogradskyella poriferorum]
MKISTRFSFGKNLLNKFLLVSVFALFMFDTEINAQVNSNTSSQIPTINYERNFHNFCDGEYDQARIRKSLKSFYGGFQTSSGQLAYRAVTTVDLNGAGAGTDANIYTGPTPGLVGATVEPGAFVSTSTGTFTQAEINFTGAVDGTREWVALFDQPAGTFNTLYDLGSTGVTATVVAGGTTFTVTHPTNTQFIITEVGSNPIPVADFNTFLTGFLYGHQDTPLTEGVRVMTVTITDPDNSLSAQSNINVGYEPLAVDDTDAIAADAVVPVTGNLLSNDTDASSGPGNVLSIFEVNGYTAAVNNPFSSTYGEITVLSDGSYSYQVDVNNIAVIGIRNGEILEDVISYAVTDDLGFIDYGYITITINGVTEPPVATDNNNSVTVGSMPSANGNVITDDDGNGPDNTDRPFANFIWENEFTTTGPFANISTPVDGQSRTDATTGITITFTSTDPDNIGVADQNQVVYQTATNGGHTGYFGYVIDGATNPVASTTTIIDFDNPVVSLSFTASDIDYSQNNTWQDQITVTATLGGVPVTYNAQVSGSVIQTSNTFHGTGSVPADDAHGNINFFFPSAVDQVVLEYNYGPDVTVPDQGTQIAAITDLLWQATDVPRVSEVFGVDTNVGTTIATTYGFITINSDGSYTYDVDPFNSTVANLPVGSTLVDTIPYTLIDSIDNSGSTSTADLIITINGSFVDPCDALASGNTDTDGDGISDACDEDDDNDGILDVFEQNCTPITLGNSTVGSGDFASEIFWLSWTGTDLADGIDNGDTAILTLPDGGTITAVISNVEDLNITESATYGADNGNGPSDYFLSDFNTFGGARLQTDYNLAGASIFANFGGPGDNNDIRFDIAFTAVSADGFTYSPDIIFADTEETNNIAFPDEEFQRILTDGENWELIESVFGTGYNISGVNTNIVEYNNTGAGVPILRSNNTSNLTVTINVAGQVGQGGQGFAFGVYLECVSIDTDNDGIPDQLDLDSDNDGIYDVDEAGNGALDTNGDGVIDSSDAGFNDGDGNGADDTAEATTPIDTGSDGSYDFQNTDSDGDGCPDANEAYGTNTAAGSDDGQFGEPDPASVDGDGLVTEAGVDYSLGTNSAVTDNSTIAGCFTIIANDDDFSATPINSLIPGSTTPSVFADNGSGTDLANGVAATNSNISNNISISNDGGMTGVNINNNGTIVVPPNTPDGTYFVEYTICLQADNTVCDSAIATIVVQYIDPCDAVASGNLDTDGDGVSDYCDQDDDNDGILDSNDIDCASGPLALGQTFSDNTGSNFNPEYVPNIYAYGGASVTFGYELYGGSAWNLSGVTSQNNPAILPDGEYINTIADGTTYPGNDVVRYYFTFTQPVYNVNFKLGGLDDFDRADFFATNGTENVPVNLSDINVGANLTINGQSAVTGASANANAPANSIAIQVDGPVTEIVITVGKQDGDEADNVELQFYEMQYCVAVDTDGDGVNDIVDLDSDNDGIYDVDEVGGVDANNDGMADGAVDPLTGIPSTAGTGITPIDTLNDGSFDYQNTDSDGDGCPDANEAYGNVTAAGSDNGQFGEPDPANVDADGLVVEGEINYSIGTNTAVTNPLLSPACNPCDATISGNDDNDGDNVSDICDADDDNDGILDIYELDCSSGPVALGQTFADATGSNFNPEYIPNLFPYNGASVTFGYELRGGVAWNGGVSSQNNGAIAPDGEYINTIPDGTDFPNGEVVNYYFTFTQPVYNVNFKVGGIDDFDRADFVATNGAQNIPVNISDINVGANLTINGQSAVTGSSANANAPFNSIQIEVQGPVTEIIVTVGKQDGSVGDVELQFYEFEYCLGLDTDGDGVDDIFDLDSDNDGIYDIDEAGNGALDTNNDGILDSNDTGFNDGDGNGADDTAEATAPVDTLSDGSYDFQNTDSDGDGCPDANEAYDNPFVSGSDGGQFGEPDPASVDANNGLVTETGVDYSIGTNAAVTDPGIATSCVINPSITTVKTFADIDGNPSTTEYSAVGEVINYTITLTNSGNVDVYSPTMVDATADAAPVRGVDAPGNNDGVLDVGETWTYIVSHTVTQTDLDNGSYTNTAEADGSADTTNDGSGDTPVDNDESETVNGIESPSIEAVKTVAITNDVAPVGASLGDTVE